MIYPAKLDLNILQGATYYKQITWRKGDGTPFDLTGAEIRMQARPADRAEDVYIDASTDNGLIELVDAPNGVFALSFPADETGDMAFPSAVYDLEVELSDGTVYRPLEGRVRIDFQVTR